LSGDCPYMEAPPCLTCNSGKPCKDLAIGFSDLESCLLLFLANSIDLTVDLICNSYFSTSKSENPIASNGQSLWHLSC
jgi:hypothetical protein